MSDEGIDKYLLGDIDDEMLDEDGEAAAPPVIVPPATDSPAVQPAPVAATQEPTAQSATAPTPAAPAAAPAEPQPVPAAAPRAEPAPAPASATPAPRAASTREARLGSARPLNVVSNVNGTPDWPAIDRLIASWTPTDLVVGWPRSEAGEEQAITHDVRGFIRRLEKRYSLPVHKTDERFSSIAAQEEIRHQRQSGQRRRRTRQGDVDPVAAALILESWFSLRADA